MPIELLLLASALFSALVLALCIYISLRVGRNASFLGMLGEVLANLEAAVARSDTTLRSEFSQNREESRNDARSMREEVARSVSTLGDSLRQSFNDLASLQKVQLDAFAIGLGEAKAIAANESKSLREQIDRALKDLREAVALLAQQTADKQEILRQTVEGRLDVMRSENSQKLEQMRQTVDEKLQATLEQRLSASFKQVSDQLEQVYKSVGEMQTLAVGVGDLKKVLTNVKTRGTWGEVALGNLLEQVLAADQYERNVEVQPGSNERVEFAIHLPGDEERPLWLPIDAKFPVDDYERLVDATERGNAADVETASKALEGRIRNAGWDISTKYVHPPHSTDFAVMFLPTEGLFAEVVRRPGLVDSLQRECHIMVAGPTTLATLLTALRMGFRSLAIQKRSSEVWRVLGAVKHEFSKFGGVMDRVSKKLDEAQTVLDEEVGRRRRAMDRKLRQVETLPEAQAVALLQLEAGENAQADEEDEEPENATE